MSLRVTNPDRVIYPEAGFTKAQLLDYYARISPVLLPHIRRRPMTLARWPDGVDGQGFFQTTCPYPPEWMETLPEGRREYCLIDNPEGLLWAVNLVSIEFHPLLSCAEDIDTPTFMILDLDPGAGAGLAECCRVALLLRDTLASVGLESFVKTSGGVGMHVAVPLNTPHTYAATKSFARTLAGVMAQRLPELVVDKQDTRLRAGRVLVDWSQNDRNKSITAVYSVRAGTWPSVSTPLRWDEVAAARPSSELRFGPDEVLARVEQYGDLFEPVLTLRQSLPPA